MRVGDDFGDQLVAPLGVGIGQAHAESMLAEVFNFGFEIAMRVVEEGLAVGHQELKIANLWPVKGREIELAQDSARDREPDAARSRVGGPDDILSTMGPARFDS